MSEQNYVIFAYGACSGNPGSGGWGAVLYSPKGLIKELGGRSPHTTNNKMELTAAIESLRFVKSKNEEILFYTDSSYVLNGITKWIWGWMKKGWVSSSGGEVSNKDFWLELLEVSKNKKIQWRYCPGHSGITGNEIADQIAVSFSKNNFVDLFYGPEKNYSHNIFPLPDFCEIPSQGGKNNSAQSNSSKPKENPQYLSYSNGIVFIHQNWSSCQASTQGISGSKYKKIKSESEIESVLKSWNLTPDKVQIKKR